MPHAAPGQIWQDDCYYLDRETGTCQRKYVLVLATDAKRDNAVTAVFTKQANGLTMVPPCSSGPPRAGHFVGTPGGKMNLPTWVEFTSLDTLDEWDLGQHIRSGRKTLLAQTLPPAVFW